MAGQASMYEPRDPFLTGPYRIFRNFLRTRRVAEGWRRAAVICRSVVRRVSRGGGALSVSTRGLNLNSIVAFPRSAGDSVTVTCSPVRRLPPSVARRIENTPSHDRHHRTLGSSHSDQLSKVGQASRGRLTSREFRIACVLKRSMTQRILREC